MEIGICPNCFHVATMDAWNKGRKYTKLADGLFVCSACGKEVRGKDMGIGSLGEIQELSKRKFA